MKPLLICDCDEVLMHFAEPFAEHVDEAHAMTLEFGSFALSGNIREKDSGNPVADDRIPELLGSFFTTGLHRQRPTPGAAQALEQLASVYDVIVLTNIEECHAARRVEQLVAAGMDYEVYCNRGPKGPALARLLEEHGADQAVFVDDLPPHHASVKREAPHVYCLHMVADMRLRGLIPAARQADARIDDWAEAAPHLLSLARENRLARAPAA